MLGNYATTSGRCFFDLSWCDCSFSAPRLDRDWVVERLQSKYGFERIQVDVVEEARKLVNSGVYVLGAKPSEAPARVDCSSLTQYLFSRVGISIPRASVDQAEIGYCGSTRPVDDVDTWRCGDLIFSSGPQNYFRLDNESGIGHVGLYTGEGTIIHATPGPPAIEEVSVKRFFQKKRQMRSWKRLLPPPSDRAVFLLHGQEIAWSKTLLRLVQRDL